MASRLLYPPYNTVSVEEDRVDALIQLIISDSKHKGRQATPRQRYFQAFDRSIVLAGQEKNRPDWDERLTQLEQMGREAGFSPDELRRRKSTLLWALGR